MGYSRALSSNNIAVEEGVQMEKSMNQIEELFGAAKDEVKRKFSRSFIITNTLK